MMVYVLSTASNDDNTFYCISGEEAALHHPADIPLWECEFAAGSSVVCVSWRGFNVPRLACQGERSLPKVASCCLTRTTGTIAPEPNRHLVLRNTDTIQTKESSGHV